MTATRQCQNCEEWQVSADERHSAYQRPCVACASQMPFNGTCSQFRSVAVATAGPAGQPPTAGLLVQCTKCQALTGYILRSTWTARIYRCKMCSHEWTV